MRRHLTAAAASLLLAAGGAVISPAVPVPAHAAPSPTPTPRTPTLPVPKATVDPRLSVGGERLASMGLVVDRPADVPAPPALKNVSWLLADMETGDVLAAKAAHARLLPASTLKTLTALTLIPQVDATRSYTATAADASADGTRVGILPGHTYTGQQLFGALLMASGNDAAYVLARAGGGMEATVAAMNEEARHLGAHDTVAKDPSGLDAPGQTSSAYDLALIGRAAMQLPQFRTYVTTKQMAFPGRKGQGGKRPTYVISNHNRLLYNYEGTVGIKNGYTNAAKRTFISAVTRGGKTYLLTEMHGLDPSWRTQAAMYDWAFRYGDRLAPVGRLVEPGTVTQPPALPSPPFTTDPATAPPPWDDRDGSAGAAAAVPRWGLTEAGLAPWVGVTGLGAAVLLVALLAIRAITRTTRDPRSG
ncbi:MAG TPA: D-alanyl-D-alanine carboxypeptidase [Streptomyces sp.]|nr:D-alanyl-D-alanine carboxypeptidase [Streptomyces sp.]